MFVIGELINGMYKDVRKAIINKDKIAIQNLAKKQVEAGADALDVNVGPSSNNPVQAMEWLCGIIQDVVDVPLCIDSTKFEAIEAGLKKAKMNAIINSTNADDNKLKQYIDLSKRFNAKLIALTMDKNGVPRDRLKRAELALKIISTALEKDFNVENLFIDPIAFPCNVAQAQGVELLESLREFKLISDPPPKTVIGLSNVSQGAKANRSLINRTFLVMAINSGLTAAIMDPLDKELMDAMVTSELLLNKNIYCDSFLTAYRKKK